MKFVNQNGTMVQVKENHGDFGNSPRRSYVKPIAGILIALLALYLFIHSGHYITLKFGFYELLEKLGVGHYFNHPFSTTATTKVL